MALANGTGNTELMISLSCPKTLAQRDDDIIFLQIVTGTSPSTRGKLPTPDTPRDCPADIWDLIQQCLVLKPEDRPSAKQVIDTLQDRCGRFRTSC